MTNEQINKEVERVAEWLWFNNQGNAGTAKWEEVVERVKNYFRAEAKQILLGHGLAVIDKDKKLPSWLKFKWANNPCCNSQEAIENQLDFDVIEDAGFMFVIPLEVKK